MGIRTTVAGLTSISVGAIAAMVAGITARMGVATAVATGASAQIKRGTNVPLALFFVAVNWSLVNKAKARFAWRPSRRRFPHSDED